MKKAEMINLLERMIENNRFLANEYEKDGNSEFAEYYTGTYMAYNLVRLMLTDRKVAKEIAEIYLTA